MIINSRRQWDVLAAHDVYPLPLVTETNWADGGWEVNVLALTEAGDGHGGILLWRHREPYVAGEPRDQAQAQRVTANGVEAFARRLAQVMAPNESGSWD